MYVNINVLKDTDCSSEKTLVTSLMYRQNYLAVVIMTIQNILAPIQLDLKPDWLIRHIVLKSNLVRNTHGDNQPQYKSRAINTSQKPLIIQNGKVSFIVIKEMLSTSTTSNIVWTNVLTFRVSFPFLVRAP